MKTHKKALFFAITLAAVGAADTGLSDGDLAAQARDPTAPVTQFQIRLDHVAGYHNLPDGDQTRLVLQPVIPYTLWDRPHIARLTLPFVLNAPDWGALSEDAARDQSLNAIPPNYIPSSDKNGLGDMSVFDFFMFDAPWPGRFALGISAILPTATDPALGSEKWSLGPALGGVATYGDLTIGAIGLFNFSVGGKSDRDDISAMTIQPIASYGLGDGWSVELSEISYSYDFNANKWNSAPLGGRIAKLVTFGNQPVRFYVDAEYNFEDRAVAPEWTYRFAMVPLL